MVHGSKSARERVQAVLDNSDLYWTRCECGECRHTASYHDMFYVDQFKEAIENAMGSDDDMLPLKLPKSLRQAHPHTTVDDD